MVRNFSLTLEFEFYSFSLRTFLYDNFVEVEVKTEELKQFVRRNSQVYIGLAGCIKEFDEIANEFVNHYSTKAFDLAMEKANKLIDAYDNETVKMFFVLPL